MIITIKSVSEELKEDGSPKYIEWTAVGADGKGIKVRLYPALQIEDKWLHFEDRWDEFKGAKDKTYDIDRASIKLDDNKVWKPVIKATAVKDILKQEAVLEVQAQASMSREQSIERQVSIKCACDIASDTDTLEQILHNAEKIAQWIAKPRIAQ